MALYGELDDTLESVWGALRFTSTPAAPGGRVFLANWVDDWEHVSTIEDEVNGGTVVQSRLRASGMPLTVDFFSLTPGFFKELEIKRLEVLSTYPATIYLADGRTYAMTEVKLVGISGDPRTGHSAVARPKVTARWRVLGTFTRTWRF